MSARPTRVDGLGYRQVMPGVWRFVDSAVDADIGAQYRTRAELLADVETFARDRGYIKTPEPETIRVQLVYQAGIANVFRVDAFNLAPAGRNARRLLQADFRTCESFARGAAAAGAVVKTAACNQAGDIASAEWSNVLDEQPFSDSFRPVFLPAVCEGCGEVGKPGTQTYKVFYHSRGCDRAQFCADCAEQVGAGHDYIARTELEG